MRGRKECPECGTDLRAKRLPGGGRRVVVHGEHDGRTHCGDCYLRVRHREGLAALALDLANLCDEECERSKEEGYDVNQGYRAWGVRAFPGVLRLSREAPGLLERLLVLERQALRKKTKDQERRARRA